jgi:putative copper export protein/methionine-rich copper-binding protein CopC
MMPRTIFIVLAIALLCLPSPVAAHGYLIRAIPEDRAVLERAPARVQYWFSEGLEPAYSEISIADQEGNVLATGGLSPNDDKLLTARLPNDLPDGAYIVDLRLAFASDGHVIAERRIFFVGQAVEGLSGAAASDQAVPLEVIWRALALSASILLLGVCVVYTSVLVPAWRNTEYPAGLLPPRVMNRLYGIAGIALVLALAGNALALIQQTMVFFDVSAIEAVTAGYWSIVRDGSRFGDTWNARMLLLGLVGVLLAAAFYVRREQPVLVRPFWTAAAWGMPLVMFTYSIGAHAAGALVLPWLALASDWLHGTMAGVWVGGVAALTLVLPAALQPLDEERRRVALQVALRCFSPLALIAALIVITTGIYNSSNWITEPNDVQTPYTLALLLKVLMVGSLLLLGALHHISLRPERYAHYQSLTRRVVRYLPTLRLESAGGLLTLVLAGWLSATPVPQPTLPPLPPAPTASQRAEMYEVQMALSPGGTGANTYDIQVSRNGLPADDLMVYVQLVNPTLGRRGALHVAESSGEGLYVAAGADAARAGEWQALIDVIDDEGLRRVAFVLPVRDEATISLTRPPSFINLLALALVLAAVGFALLPVLRRTGATLDLRPITLFVAVLAIVAGAGVVWLGVILSEQSNLQAEAAQFPLPALVNTVLPDSVSIERGEASLRESCGWESSADLGELAERLGRLRDDELFAFTGEGWRSLPPCSAALGEAARWDVVNYLRTLVHSQ